MKRLMVLILSFALLFNACGREAPPAPMVQPVSFYYRTAQTDFSAEDGVIRAEMRDLGSQTFSDLELFRLYLEGPLSEELVSPVSQDTELTGVRRSGGTLELRLTQNANSPAEFDRALTYACLAKTAFSLEGVRTVRIRISTRGGALQDDVMLSESDILLYDSGAVPEKLEITLYYADESGSFLLTEKQSIPLMNPDELPHYALERLLNVPQNGGMRSPLPPGTAVLDVSVENGICTVDFNGDFYTNRPATEQGEQLALLSVVNTLCELDGISQVQFYVEGHKLSPYVWLDLTSPWLLDSAPVGPVREELGEFEGTLCLPGQRDGLLHRLRVRARARGGASKEDALLLALFARTPQNGLSAPLAGAPVPLSITTKNGVCTVELAPQTLPAEEQARTLTIRTVTATLTSLPGVDSVLLTENGKPLTADPLQPEENWYCAP